MGFPGIRGVRCKSYALKYEKIKTKSRALDFGATCWQIKSFAGNWEVDPFVLHSNSGIDVALPSCLPVSQLQGVWETTMSEVDRCLGLRNPRGY